MYTVYALYNKRHGKLYIGQTEDLERRLELHQNKFFKNTYTSRYGGTWNIIYREEHSTRSDALKREKQLKSYRGREFVKKYIPR